jgi:hypothetical protein
MFSKIVLYVLSNKLTAGIWRMGKLVSYQTYQNNEQGHEEFSKFLQSQHSKPLFIVVDVVEEDYHLETIPHSTGKARREMLERKLNQMYRTTGYRTAQFIGREPDKRKDDRYLYTALTNAESLQVWIDKIEERQASLVGVYLLSMVSQLLVKRLKLDTPHLLLSERLDSGLRQTYFHKGILRISRLAPITADAESRLGYFYVVETEKTRLYLISQRLINSDTKLSIIMPTLEINAAKQICRDIEQEHGLDCESLDTYEIAKRLGLSTRALQTNPELLYMHLLAVGNAPANLAPVNLIRNYQVDRLRHWIMSATALVVLIGLLMTALNLRDSYQDRNRTEQTSADAKVQQELYTEVAKNFPSTPIPSTDLKLAVELQQAIVDEAITPQRFMQVVSHALDKAPEIQINRLRWSLSSDTSFKDDEKSVMPTSVQTNPQSVAQTGFVPEAGKLYEIGFVDGEIKGFNGDYRAAIESVNSLAGKIKADSTVASVEVVQQPVNVSSYSTLQGSTLDEHSSQLQAARFKLKIILKRRALPT